MVADRRQLCQGDQHRTGAVGGNQAVVRAIRGLTTQLRPTVDAQGMPVRMLATAGRGGGIMTGRHAAGYLMAGATAVQVGSANLADPGAAFRISGELAEWEVGSVREITGRAVWG